MFKPRFKRSFVHGVGFGLGFALIAAIFWIGTLLVVSGGMHLYQSHANQYPNPPITVVAPDDIEIVGREIAVSSKGYFVTKLKMRNIGSRTYHRVHVVTEYRLDGDLVNTCTLYQLELLPPEGVYVGEMRCNAMDLAARDHLEEKTFVKEGVYSLREPEE